MNYVVHKVYISSMVLTVIVTMSFLIINGYSYYNTSLEKRFYHQDHTILKPGGLAGHGLGIVGSLFMIVGVGSYMARKRMKILARAGLIKHWLEFHIFLCVMGPILVLFHTAFKFGGIVSVSFWSMIAVVISGVVGRFIYLQIPRTVEGRQLTLREVQSLRGDIGATIQSSFNLDESQYQQLQIISEYRTDGLSENVIIRHFQKLLNQIGYISKVKSMILGFDLSKGKQKKLLSLVKTEISINRKIDRLLTMQKLFRYWHVIHMPFAIVMLVIMLIHVAVTLAFGYKWIF